MRLRTVLWGIVLATAGTAQELSAAKIDAAVEAGVVWLAAQATDGGSFESARAESHKEGIAALGLLALLKAGVPSDHELIETGFDMLRKRPLVKTYDVAVIIMALEARYKPPQKLIDKAENQAPSTVTRKAWDMLAPRQDKKLLDNAVAFLIESQKDDGGWRYPDGDGSDNSATQYAMLGLKAALRLGYPVPTEIFVKAADRLLAMQPETGPEVPWFEVPAADRPIDEYLKPKKRRTSYDDLETEERPIQPAGEELRMLARGFGYRAGSERANGSMTAAGLACLVICKSELEVRRDARGYWRQTGSAINRGIRDAAAWLARSFSVKQNPNNAGRWNQYYLYGLERAGMMIGSYLLGERDWYVEGAEHLLETQDADGSWLCVDESDRFIDTCFSILFLKRATIPVLELPPPRVATGE